MLALNGKLAGRAALVVTKSGFLGDTIVATPFLRSLREAAPSTRIVLLSGPQIPALLQGCPYLDEVWTFERDERRGFRETLRIASRIRQEGFGAAFLLNRSMYSAVIARLAGIPARVGHATELRGVLLTHRVAYDWTRPDRENALDLLRRVGLRAESSLPELWVTDIEKAAARRMLAERGASLDRPLLGMQAGANDSFVREWGAERFAAAADALAAEMGFQVVLMGAADERPVCDRTAALMRHKAIVLAGETSLRQALAAISLCRLWIGNDGGLLHAAVALGPATVGIFGPSKARRWGYDTLRHRTVVANNVPCTEEPAEIRRSLDSITPEQVCQAAREALAAGEITEAVG